MHSRRLRPRASREELTPVYHGESGVRTLRELSRSYLVASKDLTRVMNRLKAIYRSWAIPCGGQQVYFIGHPIHFKRYVMTCTKVITSSGDVWCFTENRDARLETGVFLAPGRAEALAGT